MVFLGITFVSTRAHIATPKKQQRGGQLLHSRNNGDITQFKAFDSPFKKNACAAQTGQAFFGFQRPPSEAMEPGDQALL
jgi:hypothetical protein